MNLLAFLVRTEQQFPPELVKFQGSDSVSAAAGRVLTPQMDLCADAAALGFIIQ